MCSCENKIPGGTSIGDLFIKNQKPAAEVMVNYGLIDLPVSIEGAAVGVKLFGEPFSNDLAEALHRSDMSGLNGANANAIVAQTSGALNSIGTLLGGVGDLVGVFKKPTGTAPTATAGQVMYQAPTYSAPPAAPKEEPKKILGLTYGQLALVGGLVLGLGLMVFLAVSNKK
jgi:hypothetical protein